MTQPVDIMSVTLRMIEQRARRHLKEAQSEKSRGELVIRVITDEHGNAKVIKSNFEVSELIIA